MEFAHRATQSKEIAALYDEAHRLRREVIRSGFRALFDALRNLVAFAGGRTAH